jgi:hypothetical protein
MLEKIYYHIFNNLQNNSFEVSKSNKYAIPRISDLSSQAKSKSNMRNFEEKIIDEIDI